LNFLLCAKINYTRVAPLSQASARFAHAASDGLIAARLPELGLIDGRDSEE
jgi:hypothetical protein